MKHRETLGLFLGLCSLPLASLEAAAQPVEALETFTRLHEGLADSLEAQREDCAAMADTQGRKVLANMNEASLPNLS